MTHVCTEGIQCIPQKELTLSCEVDECEPLVHGMVERPGTGRSAAGTGTPVPGGTSPRNGSARAGSPAAGVGAGAGAG